MASAILSKNRTTSAVTLRHLINSGCRFRQPTAPKVIKGSFVASGQSYASNVITRSGVTFRHPEASRLHISGISPANIFSSFRTTTRFTASVIPVRPVAVTSALAPRLMLYKEFHVRVSHDDSVIRIMLRRLIEALDPRGWWCLIFTLDEDKSLQVETGKTLCKISLVDTNEGIAVRLIFMPGVNSSDMKVFVEDNTLHCKNLTAYGNTFGFLCDLPNKTYEPSDVKAMMKKGVLLVTFTNLTMEDVNAMPKY